MDGIHFHNLPQAFVSTVQHAKPASRNSQASNIPDPGSLQASSPAAINDVPVSLPVPMRMEMQYHEDLGQVVVKVIDRKTDKVIEELPSEELQRTKLSIRQAVGLIIDEEA